MAALVALSIGLAMVPACRPGSTIAVAPAVQSLPELKRGADAPDAGPAAHLAYGEKLARENRPAEAIREFQRAARTLEPGQADAMAGNVSARLAYALAYVGETE